MADLFNFGKEANTEAIARWRRGIMFLLAICGKVALVGFLLWVCMRGLSEILKRHQKTRRGGIATARTASETSTSVTAHVDDRRRLAWEREQKRLDELAAAALAEKQERIKLQQDARAAALVVKEAKERARASTLKADEARMLRRRAEDQLKLSGDAHDEDTLQHLREDAKEAVRQDQVQRGAVEQAVKRLEELQRCLKTKEQ